MQPDPRPITRNRRRLRVAGIVSAVLAVLAGFAVAFSSTASAAPTLLSQGKPATASSTENAGTPASARVRRQHRHPLVQRVHATRSGSRSTSAPPPRISQVVLQLGGGVRDRVPDPGVGQRAPVRGRTSTPPPPATGGVQTLNVTGSGRYVRMNGTARATGYGYSLWEFQVYRRVRHRRRRAAAPPTPRRASPPPRRRPRTPARRPRAAFDGNTGTRWSSAFTDPQWIQVDLGSAQHDLPGRAELGGRVRDRVPDPGRRPTAPDRGRTSTPPPPAPAAPRPSTSPAPAGTCG